MTHWSCSYIGIGWRAGGRDAQGCDCWGCVRLVYQDVAKIALDPLNGLYITAEEREDIAAIVAGEMAHGPWRAIAPGAEHELDVLLFRCFGLQSHVGVVAGRGLMLHATAGQTSAIERYQDGRWRPRLCGIFRHKDML